MFKLWFNIGRSLPMAKETVLTVGDGNLSFSLSLLKQHAPFSLILVATLFEKEDKLTNCPKSLQNQEALLKNGITVIHEVDGTKLDQSQQLVKLGLKYDKIIFNFPHTGGKSQIQKNRQLLEDFFKSAVSRIVFPTGQIDVALCKGQGGTPIDCQKRGYENSWKIVEMAAEADLVLTKVEPFDCELFPDYTPTGYRGLDKGFVLSGALVHTFMIPGCCESLFPPTYTHDVSFWCLVADFDESKLISVLKHVTEDNVKSIECIDRYELLDKVSYCYRLGYCSLTGALSRSCARDYQLLVRQALQEQLSVELR